MKSRVVKCHQKTQSELRPITALRHVRLPATNGRLCTFAMRGDRPPVLLLHGNSSCKEVFVNQIIALRRHGFGVVVPDLPGHGGSDDARSAPTGYSFPGYASAIGALMDRLAIAQAHVVGWSMGGHVGLELLASDKRIRSLLICGAPPVRLDPGVVARAFHHGPAMELTGRRVLSERQAEMYGRAALGGKQWLAGHLLRAIRRTDGKARYWMVRNSLSGIGADEAALVQTSPKPLAIVQGRSDPFVRADYLESLTYRNLWRGAVQYVDAGHAPHWQRPQKFNKLLLEFLNDARQGK